MRQGMTPAQPTDRSTALTQMGFRVRLSAPCANKLGVPFVESARETLSRALLLLIGSSDGLSWYACDAVEDPKPFIPAPLPSGLEAFARKRRARCCLLPAEPPFK